MNINTMPGASLPLSQGQESVKKAGQLEREKDLEKACQGFEALMLNSLMKAMRETVPDEDVLFPKSNKSDIYQSLHDQHLTEKLSQGKQALGLKEFLYRQLQDSL